MMKIVNFLLDIAAIVGLMAMVVVLILVSTGQVPEQKRIKTQAKDLNERYVFVNPYPQDLPDNVNLCIDVIKPGVDRDTVWLMPDHESAGY
jgi:hypothetical protein